MGEGCKPGVAVSGAPIEETLNFMKKLTVAAAAALVAGMTAFAADAREAYKFVPSAKADDAAAQPVNAVADQPVFTPTGRDGSGSRPHLTAVARKKTVVKGEVVVEADIPVGKQKPGLYQTIISRYAATYGVPVSLAQAVISVESNYRVNARGSAGEIGLMQIKPATARSMGYSGKLAGLYNPETNIRYGMKYLGMAHKLSGGTTCGTILRYNAGHGAKRMNPVSAAYCRKVQSRLGA
jgi:soluble lytic murein transglycosylase-like protein